MIDLAYDCDVPQHKVCECGDPECLGSTHVVATVLHELPVIQSPILKLVKERNEARRLCALLAVALPDLVAVKTSQKACDAANSEMHTALMTYVKMSKDWDERTYQLGGAQ
jgi:hypothetical protein